MKDEVELPDDDYMARVGEKKSNLVKLNLSYDDLLDHAAKAEVDAEQYKEFTDQGFLIIDMLRDALNKGRDFTLKTLDDLALDIDKRSVEAFEKIHKESFSAGVKIQKTYQGKKAAKAKNANDKRQEYKVDIYSSWLEVGKPGQGRGEKSFFAEQMMKKFGDKVAEGGFRNKGSIANLVGDWLKGVSLPI